MESSNRLVFFCGLVLLVLGLIATSAQAQEAPRIDLRANAPGWITVYWEHTGKDVYSFVIERQDPPYSDNNILPVGQSSNNTDSLTDKNLRADTTYKYRVCAVYAYNRTCSDWKSARTLPPPPPPSGGSSGGTSSKPKHELRTPNLKATTNHPLMILLHWGSDSSDLYTLGNVQLYRDGQIAYDAKKYGGFAADYQDNGKLYDSANQQWTGQSLRANTEYTYKVCFIGFSEAEGETKCSTEITVMGQPVAPTALGDVSISKSLLTRGVRNASGSSRIVGSVRITTLISAKWRNTDLPGQFITLERENRVQLDRMRVGPAWDEIARISAKSAPTEASADITSSGPELGTQHLNNYRVCAVVPALKSAGKVCSPPVAVQ
jgi:hypothetical protein